MDINDILYMISTLIIRAGPEPKNCYICGADRQECKRYVLPTIYFLTDLYCMTWHLELLKNIKVFWLCTEHYALFDENDRRGYWRDLSKPLIVKKNPTTGEALVKLHKNPLSKQAAPDLREEDFSGLSVGALHRILNICALHKRCNKAILSVVNNEFPAIEFSYSHEEGCDT